MVAVGFGFDGAHFANSATRITYEEMLSRFELGQNAALSKVGSIVRFLESGAPRCPRRRRADAAAGGAAALDRRLRGCWARRRRPSTAV